MDEENRKKVLAHAEHSINILKTRSFTAKELLQWNENTRKEILKIDPTGEGLAAYDKFVEPTIQETLDKKIKELHGEDYFKKFNEDNKNRFNFRNNPLRDIENPTLDDIHKNWISFVAFASIEKGGPELIKQTQSFFAEKILNDAEDSENKGTFDFKKISEGLDEYRDILDEGYIVKIEKLIEMANTVTPEMVEARKKVAEAEQKVKDLQEEGRRLDLERIEIEKEYTKSTSDLESETKLRAEELSILKEEGAKLNEIVEIGKKLSSFLKPGDNGFVEAILNDEITSKDIEKYLTALKKDKEGSEIAVSESLQRVIMKSALDLSKIAQNEKDETKKYSLNEEFYNKFSNEKIKTILDPSQYKLIHEHADLHQAENKINLRNKKISTVILAVALVVIGLITGGWFGGFVGFIAWLILSAVRNQKK